jgi:predicted GTPase
MSRPKKIVGRTGSGKSSNINFIIISDFIKANAGSSIVACSPEDAEEWRRRFEAASNPNKRRRKERTDGSST